MKRRVVFRRRVTALAASWVQNCLTTSQVSIFYYALELTIHTDYEWLDVS